MGMARVAIATLLIFNLIIIIPSLAVAQNQPVPRNNIPIPKMLPRDNLPGPYGYGSQQPQNDPQQIVAQQQPNEQQLPNEQPQPIQQQQPIQQRQPNEQPNVIDVNLLQENFYGQSCPRAEEIVAKAVAGLYSQDPQSLAILLRLQFHDCFVGGCDASVLLDYTDSAENVEKSSMANGQLLKGADLIDDIKAMLEQECPETVSCADTLAFAAHEARILAGLPRSPQRGGRRDSMFSLAANVDNPNNLPLPYWTLDQMLALFQKKGFTAEDMVVLIGAHSIGGAHCDVLKDRIYNFKQSGKPDPVLNLDFLNELQGKCKLPEAGLPVLGGIANFDATPTVLDNLFYKNLLQKKSLLTSDQELADDPRTAPIVQKLADDPQLFTNMFAEAINRMAAMNVITGNNGQVRRTCRSTN